MERIAGLGWFGALIVVIISFALPYLWGDFGYSIASLLWETEGALECSKVFESDEKCVRVRQELLINWAGNIRSSGQVTVYYPRTVNGLQSVVRLAKAKRAGVRVVGARHSWSRALLQIPEETLLVSLISKKKVTELSSVGDVEVNGDGEAEVEVGGGATLGELAERCRTFGWQVASAPVLPQVTLAQDHGTPSVCCRQ